ncbi:Calcium permeable stress-gated cation channel 1 [Hibiscus syriacus]|uniref:Calcium permeable stress-gated cation channel 1 n=1 Tax=Hibiscus syriacus TaxID=106335 RepID=A0A6A3AB58_HIBSY|nr:Calcium permeable stress-gated cation channel 1 [Hibiscus syriacus]
MATLSDIGLAAAINILSAFAFFLAFAFLRIQPVNDRVYFPKWYIKGLRFSPLANGAFASKFVNLDFRSYARFLSWMPAALQMPEPELIDHAGLDSAVYLRIYLLGLKIFVPIAFLAFAIMVPVNWTNNTLEHSGLTFSDIDKLSISNIPNGSNRYWTHLVMAYAFTFWTCYALKQEYEIVAAMRLHFLASEHRRPDQFTVLVRNVPPDPDESVSEFVEHFFLVNHPYHYLSHQVVYNANKLSGLVKEKKKIQNWLDYYKIKYERNPSKRPLLKTGFLGLWGDSVDAVDFYTAKIERLARDIATEREKITNNPKSIMPTAFVSFKTQWGAAVCAQTQQCHETHDLTMLNLIPKTIGASIPMKATFFITYIMVDGWAGVAAEILRLKPLIIYHLKNFFLVKTEKDREEAMDPGTIGFNTGEPQIQLYFLLGLVYAVVTPILLPFIIVFFGLAYVVFRHQIINVYNQEYESAAAFWPDVHLRIIVALIVSQLLLMGLLSTVLTIWFHRFCKERYEPAFVRYPLQEAMMKDTLERAREPNLNLKGFLQNAYMHPVFKSADDNDVDVAMEEWEEEPSLISTKRTSKRSTPLSSKHGGSSFSLPS